MLSAKGEAYLQEILSYIRFTFDRKDIRTELESHLTDKSEYYVENGFDSETAEQLSIQDMGDAKEIGIELNKQHNPVIGWIWRITNVITAILMIIFYYVLFTLLSANLHNGLDRIAQKDIEYTIDLKEKVKIDDRVVCITRLIYESNGDMNIYYKTYNARLWGTGWNPSYIGEVTDNFGHKYVTGSGQSRSGIICRGVWTVDQFSEDANSLIITYDLYNRRYKIEIPLKAGDNNE